MSTTDRRTFVKQTAGSLAAMALVPDLSFAAPIRRGAPLSVAVIGVGRQGRAIIGELQKMEAANVTAICDVDESRLRSGARRAPGATSYTTHAELLDNAKDAQAVFIATPTHLHKQIAIEALQAGRHVYCETPLAHTVEDCRQIVAAARNASSIFQAGLCGRSNPVYKLARSFYKSDAVRDLVAMRAQYHRKTTWRVPAPQASLEKARNWKLDPEVSLGLAGEQGTHQFDVFHYFLGRYPTSISGRGDIRMHKDGREIHDTIHCDVLFDNGAQLDYRATLANSFEGTHEVLYGTNASIKLAWTNGWMFKEADAPTQGWEVYANRQQFHNDEGITLIAGATKLAAQGKLKDGIGLEHPPVYYSVADFLKSVIDGDPVAAGAEVGMRATVVGILANQAIVTGRQITLDENTLKGA